MNRLLAHGAIRRHSSLSFVFSAQISQALKWKRPVVALESSVITHGLPHPENLRTAQSLERIIIQEGAVPAIIALDGGRIRVGLEPEQLYQLAMDDSARKVSSRDIPTMLTKQAKYGDILTAFKNRMAGTTVAATMLLANRVGIDIFATGGIGGVHQGVADTFDISADLLELSRTPVSVICAGIKSILDVSKTLEYLWFFLKKNSEFPGFFTEKTGHKAPFVTNDIDELVEIIVNCEELHLPSRPLIMCPIPEKFAIFGTETEEAIRKAQEEADREKVKGKNATPFLLKKVGELTDGKSLIANVALLENNAKIAARLAVKCRKWDGSRRTITKTGNNRHSEEKASHSSVVCFGATLVDFDVQTDCQFKLDGGTYEGQQTQSCEGVARNHADALARLLGRNRAHLVSVMGCDSNAQFIRSHCAHMNLEHLLQDERISTATHTSIHSNGSICFSVGSIAKTMARITPEIIRSKESLIANADFVLMDGNLMIESMRMIVEISTAMKVPVWFEPTDLRKMDGIFAANCFHLIHTTSPNANEFVHLCESIKLKIPDKSKILLDREATGEFLLQNSQQLLSSLNTLIVTLDQAGSVIAQKSEASQVVITLLPGCRMPILCTFSRFQEQETVLTQDYWQGNLQKCPGLTQLF